MKNQSIIFVEKKKEFDVESANLLKDVKNFTTITSLESVRFLNKYLVSGIDDKTYQKSLTSIFSEPMVDIYYENSISNIKNFKALTLEFLPGQFDQRAESAIQCLTLINPNLNPIVKTAKVYLFPKSMSAKDFGLIKKFLINPSETREVPIYDKVIKSFVTKNSSIKVLNGFIGLTVSGKKKLHLDLNLAMSSQDLDMVQEYFKQEKRNPTITEIKIIDTYWSDHCRHTTFETKLTNIVFDKKTAIIEKTYNEYLKARDFVYKNKKAKNICLMDIATIAAKNLKKQGLLTKLDESDEINACSINIDVETSKGTEKYLLMFKNETHNHPTEIEPFGGASTCLGGAIRDPLSGRSYVYQAMRVTGCADPTIVNNKLMSGKLSQRVITTQAANGYSSYGNQIGLATSQVDEIYHPNYVAKRMEVGAVIAAAPKSNVVRRTPKLGDIIILLGGKTGKDGIGGATGSSKLHKEASLKEAMAEVQKGNPVEERKIQRLFKNKHASRLIVRCNDFGAGGISVSIGELCDGLEIDLNKVVKKYEGLDGTELALSESQERMSVVVSKKDAKKFIKLANDENLEATIVAKVTNSNRLKMLWNNKIIVDLSRTFLNTNGFLQTANVTVQSPKSINYQKNSKDIKSSWIKMMSDLNVCSKLGLIQKFDSTIGANSVLMPLGGKHQLTPTEGMVGKIPTFGKDSKTVSLMSYGFNPFLGELSPFHMAYYAVIESITKIVALGGDYKNVHLSFQEYFGKLGVNNKMWGLPFGALLGAFKAQNEFNLAAIGGKDSMSGTFENINVPPTLISFAVGTQNIKNIISPEFKQINSSIVLLSPIKNGDETIDIKKLMNGFNVVQQLVTTNKIISAYSLKHNGIAEGITKMMFGNKIGAKLVKLNLDELFNHNYGALLLEIPNKYSVKSLFKNLNYKCLGKTISASNILINDVKLSCNELLNISTKKLEKIFPFFVPSVKDNADSIKPHINKTPLKASKKITKPLVVIPVFPGTNCEFDSQIAFEKAGARVQQVLIRNLNKSSLLKSINELANAITKAHILFLPGGFSSGDEPDGSAKFIVNVFHNEKIKKTTMGLVARKCLIIGVCNGFQALIKLGLVPYGKIMNMTPNMPTLTYNNIRHHMSTLIRTKIVSTKSPWLKNAKVGQIHTLPVSHGEGNFIASKELIEKLIKNGQIVSQYVDLDNNPTNLTPFNPNGSCCAIEAITNEDGRILGKMAHSERIGSNLYKNVPGNFDQKLFKSAVEYFSK